MIFALNRTRPHVPCRHTHRWHKHSSRQVVVLAFYLTRPHAPAEQTHRYICYCQCTYGMVTVQPQLEASSSPCPQPHQATCPCRKMQDEHTHSLSPCVTNMRHQGWWLATPLPSKQFLGPRDAQCALHLLLTPPSAAGPWHWLGDLLFGLEVRCMSPG